MLIYPLLLLLRLTAPPPHLLIFLKLNWTLMPIWPSLVKIVLYLRIQARHAQSLPFPHPSLQLPYQ